LRPTNVGGTRDSVAPHRRYGAATARYGVAGKIRRRGRKGKRRKEDDDEAEEEAAKVVSGGGGEEKLEVAAA